MTRTDTPQPDDDARARLWLDRLQRAPQPLSQKALFGRSPTPADRRRLAQWLADGRVVNLGSGRAMALVGAAEAQGRLAPLNLARRAVLDHLGLGLKPLALTDHSLGQLKGVPGFVRPKLRQAVTALVNEGLLVPLRHGRTSLVVGVAGLRHHLEQTGSVPGLTAADAPTGTDSRPTAAPLTPEALAEAYRRVLPVGGSMVEIGALQRSLGCERDALHALLRRLATERRLFLVPGEPSLLSEADRAAALPHEGRRYHCVELRPA